LIEVEVQNETHQNQQTLRFAALPRIGEGVRLMEPDGFWTSYDIVDLWYQKAEFGDVWVPYIHIRMTPSEQAAKDAPGSAAQSENIQDIIDQTKTITRILTDHELT